MTTIGVVGLGAMGGRIAGRLLAQGNAVRGTNRARSAAYEHRDIAVMFRVLSDLIATPPGGPPGTVTA